jgi:hypothetical protein
MRFQLIFYAASKTKLVAYSVEGCTRTTRRESMQIGLLGGEKRIIFEERRED